MNDAPRREPLLRWARALAPREDRAWLEAMAEEVEFVPRGPQRWRWRWGALGLALRWRLRECARARTFVTALASALTVVLMAVLLIVPQTSTQRASSAQAEPPFAPHLASPRAGAPTLDAPSADSPAAADFARAERLAEAQPATFTLAHPDFALRARRAVTLTVGRAGLPEATQTLAAGARLELRAPVTVTTPDAGALELFVGDASRGAVGEDGEELTLRFTVSP